MPHVSNSMQQCIEECQDCSRICIETINHCLEKGSKHASASHIRLLQDCADICQTSANFLSRGSDLHTSTCGVCAEVCEKCAVSCEQFNDDADMKRCADACRSCAQSCQQMSSGKKAA